MNLIDYKNQIETMLGAPVLEIEVSDRLENIIQMAFNELKLYIDTPSYITLNSGGTDTTSGIDVSEYRIRAILYVMRGTISAVNAEDSSNSLLWSPLNITLNQNTSYSYNFGNSKSQYSQLNLLKAYNTSMIYQQLRSSLQTDLDYTFDVENQRLYVFQQIPKSDMITVVCNREYSKVEDVKDPFWCNLLFRLSLAYTKQILGRIRGKYRMTSAPYELDSETLLSESNTELTEIRSFLSENNNVFIPRD